MFKPFLAVFIIAVLSGGTESNAWCFFDSIYETAENYEFAVDTFVGNPHPGILCAILLPVALTEVRRSSKECSYEADFDGLETFKRQLCESDGKLLSSITENAVCILAILRSSKCILSAQEDLNLTQLEMCERYREDVFNCYTNDALASCGKNASQAVLRMLEAVTSFIKDACLAEIISWPMQQPSSSETNESSTVLSRGTESSLCFAYRISMIVQFYKYYRNRTPSNICQSNLPVFLREVSLLSWRCLYEIDFDGLRSFKRKLCDSDEKLLSLTAENIICIQENYPSHKCSTLYAMELCKKPIDDFSKCDTNAVLESCGKDASHAVQHVLEVFREHSCLEFEGITSSRMQQLSSSQTSESSTEKQLSSSEMNESSTTQQSSSSRLSETSAVEPSSSSEMSESSTLEPSSSSELSESSTEDPSSSSEMILFRGTESSLWCFSYIVSQILQTMLIHKNVTQPLFCNAILPNALSTIRHFSVQCSHEVDFDSLESFERKLCGRDGKLFSSISENAVCILENFQSPNCFPQPGKTYLPSLEFCKKFKFMTVSECFEMTVRKSCGKDAAGAAQSMLEVERSLFRGACFDFAEAFQNGSPSRWSLNNAYLWLILLCVLYAS